MEPSKTHRVGTIRRLQPGAPVPTEPPRKYVTTDGYIVYRWRIAPRTYVEALEHRIIDGRVTTARHVHHRNGDTTDNRPENLQPVNPTEHRREHSHVDYEKAWRLYKSGLSTIEVGKWLGCNPATISRGLRDRGHKLRDSGTGRRLDLDSRRIVALFLAGESPQRIGTILGVSDTPIRRILRNSGIQPRSVGRPVRSPQ